MTDIANEPGPQPAATHDEDAARLSNLGYTQELSRVLGLFGNFSVAFSYLSPMVGVYSLFILGAGAAGPAYIWLMPLVVLGMLMVALVFGELGSHYPVAGAIYQYGKYSVSAGYGWWVGWLYGMALLVTVASVDTGVVSYVTALSNQWFGTKLDPTSSATILVITIVLILIQTTMNAVGAKLMSRVTELGVYVETIGTFGVAIALAIVGFHHGLGFLFETHGAQHVATNPLAMNFNGNWLTGAALVAILAHVYIFYGFESAGDIAEETRDASRQVPRAMRSALIYGGVASFVLVAALLLATPASDKGYAAVFAGGGVPGILSELPQWLQDFFLVMVIIAFFSCGTAVQGAGARLAYSFARDGAVPAHKWVGHISPRFRTPVNAIVLGALVPIAFALLVNINPSSDIKILWFTYPKGINPLTALVSFGVSGIYLSFLLTVIGSMIARARGWVPEGVFKLGRWGWLVSWLAAAYLAVMLVNVVLPSGLSSPRAFFNIDWITLNVMVVIAVVGAIYFFVARPDRALRTHLHDELEPTAAEREAQ